VDETSTKTTQDNLEAVTTKLKEVEAPIEASQKKFQLMGTIIGSLLKLFPCGSIGSLSDGAG
jgi:hypothetical protein